VIDAQRLARLCGKEHEMAAWLLLVVVSTALGFGTQAYINSTYRRWSDVPVRRGLTGAEVAQRVLASGGIVSDGVIAPPVVQGGQSRVRIQAIGGSLSDNYDPRDKTLNLSEGVYAGASVAAAGVAAHEAGHAIQDAQGYVWGRLRGALVPAASFGSGAAVWLIIIGAAFFGASQLGMAMVYAGLVFFGFAVLFQFVTLPVELNASRRAMSALESSAILDGEELAGARKVLTAAAFTYVAAALVAALQFLYFLGFARRD
jgi:Zn-dependent membrane protease YugP